MKRIATALMTIALVTAAWPGLTAQAAPAEPAVMRFGMEASSIDAQKGAGVDPDYGTFWVGPWTLKHGWYGPDQQLAKMRDAGVTPAIHYYYWGDDISQDCINNGCYSDLHGSWKDQAGWDRLGRELTDHLHSQMQGREVVIFLETEFNKADLQYYEPLDAMLAQKANEIHERYPNAKVVLSLGSWNRPAWTTWDRAAAASDMIGIQGMRGSTRDSLSHYEGLYESTLAGAHDAKRYFGKPVFIQDLALSSYPEPDYIPRQEAELRQFFTNMDELKAAGVEALVYRSWTNSPSMDLKNYYGQAERHWGLYYAYSEGYRPKPSAQVWIDGVQAERSGAVAPAPSEPAGSFEAQFQQSSGVNEWWVDVRVTSSSSIAKVEASHNGGSWTTLSKTSWGTYAKSFHAPNGGTMAYRATDTAGQTAMAEFTWTEGKPVAAPEPAPYTADFRPSKGNEWWVEVRVDAAEKPAKVEASHNGGAWHTLPATSWGSHAKSFHAPYGGTMAFRATNAEGQSAMAEFTWPGGQPVSNGTQPEPQPEPEPNNAPVAAFNATADGLTVRIDGAASSDADGDPLSYAYDLGDGTNATGMQATHSYAKEGSYTIVLTVDDGKDTASTQQVVQVTRPNQAPTAVLDVRTSGMKVDVDARRSSDPDGDALAYVIDLGDGTQLKQATGSHTYAKAGTYTVKLTVSDGKASHTTTTQVQAKAAPFTASFQPASNANEWWVEVGVQSSSKPAKVEASINGGAWTVLPANSWGTYAKSFHAPPGEARFRATDAHGQVVTSPSMPWLGGGFDATFTPKAVGNAWWVEVDVDASKPLARVEARVNNGAWTELPATKWGTHAKSMHVQQPGDVVFRATSTSGETVTSQPVRWV